MSTSPPTRASRACCATSCSTWWVATSGTSTPPTTGRGRNHALLGGRAHTDEELQDQQRALDAYLAIVDLDPGPRAGARAVGAAPTSGWTILPTRLTTWRAEQHLRRQPARRGLLLRIGKRYEEKLGNRGQARNRLRACHRPAPDARAHLERAQDDCARRADWALATRYLDTEQQNTESSRERAKLLVDLGRIRDEMLEQHELAIEAYQLALQADNDDEDAALPLAREHERVGRFQEAEPLADMLVRKSGKREREEQLDLHLPLLARITASLRKFDVSLGGLPGGAQVQSDQPGVGARPGRHRLQAGDWAGMARQLPEGARRPR